MPRPPAASPHATAPACHRTAQTLPCGGSGGGSGGGAAGPQRRQTRRSGGKKVRPRHMSCPARPSLAQPWDPGRGKRAGAQALQPSLPITWRHSGTRQQAPGSRHQAWPGLAWSGAGAGRRRRTPFPRCEQAGNHNGTHTARATAVHVPPQAPLGPPMCLTPQARALQRCPSWQGPLPSPPTAVPPVLYLPPPRLCPPQPQPG